MTYWLPTVVGIKGFRQRKDRSLIGVSNLAKNDAFGLVLSPNRSSGEVMHKNAFLDLFIIREAPCHCRLPACCHVAATKLLMSSIAKN